MKNILNYNIERILSFLEKKNIEGLIIDVRNNAGGYLSAASDVASIFLEKGKTIYSLQANNKQEEAFFDVGFKIPRAKKDTVPSFVKTETIASFSLY